MLAAQFESFVGPLVIMFTVPLAMAGAALMNRRSFTSANIVGSLPWAVGLPLLGYFAYQAPVLRQLSYALAGISIVGSVIAAVVITTRDRAARRAAAAIPALR